MSELEDVVKLVLESLGPATVAVPVVTGVGKSVYEHSKAATDVLLNSATVGIFKVVEKAHAKSRGKPIDATDRVKYKVLQEAIFTEDEIIAEYLGGVLAASGAGSDPAAAVVPLIGRLSADQLRLHYVTYRELRRIWSPTDVNLYQSTEAMKGKIRIDLEDLIPIVSRPTFVSDIPALSREGLLTDAWKVIAPENDVPGYIEVTPTGLGAELFMWGHGAENTDANAIFSDAHLMFLAEIAETPSSRLASTERKLGSEV